MHTVAIMEGFAGGPRISRTFRRALEAAGFKITNPKHAEIIVAHSAACYDLPKQSKAKIYMLIGPPHWPGLSIIKRTRNKVQKDKEAILSTYGRKHWRKKKRLQRFYIIVKPKYLWLVLNSNSKNLDFLEELQGKNVILVRNHDDDYCTPDIKDFTHDFKHVKYVSLPGGHDDCYTNPKPYIDLLLKEL